MRLLLPLRTTAEKKTTTVVYDSRADIEIHPSTPQVVLFAHLARSPFGLHRCYRGNAVDSGQLDNTFTYENMALSEDNQWARTLPNGAWSPVLTSNAMYSCTPYPPATEGFYARPVGGLR